MHHRIALLALAVCGCDRATPPPAAAPVAAATLPQSGPPQAQPAPPQAAAAQSDTADCASVVPRAIGLLATASDETLRNQGAKVDVNARVAACTSEAWSTTWLACAAAAKSGDDLVECDRAMFGGNIDLAVNRELDMRKDQSATTPAPGEQDGDLLLFDFERKCGLLLAKRPPAEAMFVHCGGKAVAGPYVTPAEIEGVSKDLQKEIAAKWNTRMEMSRHAYEIGRSIRANWPQAQRVKVYDQRTGNYLGDEYR